MTQPLRFRRARRAPVLGAAVILCTLTVAAEDPPPAATGSPEPMPRDEEIAAALEAGPASIAERAGIYLLDASGYVRVRDSGNGYNCLVTRSVAGAFEPQCLDEEGSATILREILMAAELRSQGKSPAEVDQAVAAAYADGRLRAPRRPGINYMLSPRNRVPVDDHGTVRPYRPHVMFYVPYLTNEDLGAGPGSPVFVISEGTPRAYAIGPVPP